MTQNRVPARVCSRIGFALCAMMAAWLGGFVLLGLLFRYFWPSAPGNIWITWLLNDIPLYLIGVPLYLLVLGGLPDGPAPARERPPMSAGKLILAVLFCLGAAYALNLLAQLLVGLLTTLAGPTAGAADGTADGTAQTILSLAEGGVLPGLIFGCIIPAFGEEFLFRRVLHRKLRGAADATYIFVSALSFGLFHASIVQTPYAFVIGATLAWLYSATGSIYLCVGIHFSINALSVLLLPALLYSPLAAGLWGLLILLLIPTGITLFCVFRKAVFSTFRPPEEAGWPYRSPRWLPKYLQLQAARRQLKLAAAQRAQPYPAAAPQPYPYAAAPPQPYPYPTAAPQPYPYTAAAPQPLPYPAAPPQPFPYLTAAPQPYPYTAMPAPKTPGALSRCVSNPGMLTYVLLAAALIITNLVLNLI